MSAGLVTVAELHDAAVGACEVVAAGVLGASGQVQASARDGIPANLAGAFIPLAGPGLGAQFGLVGSEDECRGLAAALLQVDAAEAAALSPTDVADAVCEVVNIAAGHVKARLSEAHPGLTLGLPLFIQGAVKPRERMAVDVFDVRAGGSTFVVVLLLQGE
ncbi:MAG: Chemotaxis phosphatase CheX [Pseudomonadota bacterium]